MPSGKTLRRRAGACSLAALALLAALGPAAAWSSLDKAPHGPLPSAAPKLTGARKPFLAGEAIVRFEPTASAAERRGARRATRVAFEDTLGIPRAQLVEVEGSVQTAVRRLERRPGVAYAQPNYRYAAAAVEPPDDSFFSELWGLSDPAPEDPGLSALEAWETTEGGGQVIAILDTGVDLTHPDLLDNLWENPAPDPVDEDLHGFDFVDDDGDPDDYAFHGTHVAGTAAAVADNTQGIAGVAPAAEIMAVRVLNGDGTGSTAEIVAGVGYAADHGADVINMSLGGPAGPGDQIMADAIEAAGDEAGAVVVVAAGNDGANVKAKPESPCVLPAANLICVAALNRSGTLASFSNYGVESVDLAAPGASILSSKPDYGPPVFEDGFELEPSPWSTAKSGGGEFWGLTKPGANSEFSATDSPAGDYGKAAPGAEEPATSELFTTDPVSLAAERGCRLHFNTKYEIETGFDVFLAGAVTESSLLHVNELDGISTGYPGSFTREQVSVSELDGRTDVSPFFAVFSDEEVQLDGAYVDDVRLLCRDETYLDAIAGGSNYDQPESGSYVRFQGTSMATPHVAGEVALVRAAAPGLDPEDVVKAVLDGASAIPTFAPGKLTVTEGIADACKAIALATAGDVGTKCPASSNPSRQPPIDDGSDPQDPPPPSSQSPTGEQPPSNPQGSAPETRFRKHPAKVLRTRGRTARAVFRFASDEANVAFLCKLDRGPFRPCPRTLVRRLEPGPHVLGVKARDADGMTDRTPAVYRFRVKRIE